MCGLILIEGANTPIEADDALDALCASVGGRGPHAHGWHLLAEDGTWHRTIDAGPITHFPEGEWLVALGHSRLGTSGFGAGTTSLCDTQPFTAGRWILAHNGTLKAHNHQSRSDTAIASQMVADGLPLPEAFATPDDAPQAVIAYDTVTRTPVTYRTGSPRPHPIFWNTQPDLRILASCPFRGSTLANEGITTWPTI